MGRPTSYSLSNYGDMITDRARMGPYARALRRVVQDGAVVVDIGAGTGVFSLLACAAGAAQVHAVEPDPSIEVARLIAAANGVERIAFHQELSTRVSLPTPADVIISDLRGVLPLLQQHIPSIVDARERLLAPGGQLVPQADSLWAAVVEAPKLYQPFAEPWLDNDYDLDMRAGHQFVVNSWRKANLEAEQLLVEPQRWATLDYRTIDSADVSGKLEWTVERAGIGHGLALWFDTTLAEGIGFSNAPGQPELIYGQAFFPWQEAVALDVGDVISADVRANLVGGEYIWRWKSRLRAADGQGTAAFDQSTFLGSPLGMDQLRKRAATYVPTLDIEGEVDRFLLVAMDGQASLEDIARRAAARFPEHFSTWKAALTRAGELAVKFSR